MTRHRDRRRRAATGSILGVAAVVATFALSGCSQDATPPQASPQPGSVTVGALPSEHVHGVGRDPGNGKVNLATHQGLFVLQSDGRWHRVGPEIDLMGFAVSGPGAFYASGHPAAGVDLPAPVGLMQSTDAGSTWTVLSRGGQSDFHALTTSSAGVLGYDGALRATKDGKNWTEHALPGAPSSLAASPNGAQVLATTNQGVLSSTDGGATWAALASAPPLFLTAWANSKTIVGVTTKGGLAVSEDAGRSWTIGAAKVTSAQAVSASRTPAGLLEFLVVTNSGVLQTSDNGATLNNLTS
ncbi:MAG: exo-alpha-sialidase [Candidatus Phosphoribacter sp.]